MSAIPRWYGRHDDVTHVPHTPDQRREFLARLPPGARGRTRRPLPPRARARTRRHGAGLPRPRPPARPPRRPQGPPSRARRHASAPTASCARCAPRRGSSIPTSCTVFDSGAAARRGTAELLWFTMPYVEGESLRERLRREVQLPLDQAVRDRAGSGRSAGLRPRAATSSTATSSRRTSCSPAATHSWPTSASPAR